MQDNGVIMKIILSSFKVIVLSVILSTSFLSSEAKANSSFPLDSEGLYDVCDAFAYKNWQGIHNTLNVYEQNINSDRDFLNWLHTYNEYLICGGEETDNELVWIDRIGEDQYYDGRTTSYIEPTSGKVKTRTNPLGQHILKIAVEGKAVGFFGKLNGRFTDPADVKKVKEILTFSEKLSTGKNETVLQFIDRLFEDTDYEEELLGRVQRQIKYAIEK